MVRIICSECGTKSETEGVGSYCPNCGYKIVEIFQSPTSNVLTAKVKKQ